MRTIFVLLVAMLAAPAFADGVDVNCTCPEDSCEVTVQYINDDPCHVRAFALDIFLDNPDANIVSVHGYDPEVDDYFIYPGSIDVNTDTNNIDDYGSFIANVAMYPYATCGTRPGLDSNAMTIEMGSLYVGESNAPAGSNILFKFIVSADTNVIITENAKRGGIVMEPNGHSPTSINFSTCQAEFEPPVKCFPEGHADYNDWVAHGEPNCWCGSGRQCRGDGADDLAGTDKDGYFYVGATDLQLLVDAWYVLEPPNGDGITSIANGICADFAHDLAGTDKDGYFYVGATDLQILVDHWYILEPPNGDGVPGDCLDVP